MSKLLLTFLLFFATIAQAQRNYYNNAFGISITIPEGWLEANYPDTTFKLTLTDKERTELLEREDVYLTSFFERRAMVKGGLIPKVQMNCIIKPESSFEEFKSKFIESTEHLVKQLENVKFIQKTEEITVSGIKSMHFVIEYSWEVAGTKMRTRNHTYAIPYKNYMFHISLTDGNSADCSAIFDELVKTVKVGFKN